MDEATAQRYASVVAEALQRGHNVMLVGERGSGKTMVARRAVGYFSPLNVQESKKLDDIYSYIGMAAPGPGAVASRPFRAPHYSVSQAAMVGTKTRPGEISLALYGVLFMDEFSAFRRVVLDDVQKALSRGNTSAGWDSDPVYLVAAMSRTDPITKLRLDMFSTIIDLDDLDEQPVSQSAARTTQKDPRPPRTEHERMADFFFGKPGSLKRSGLAGKEGLMGLPAWKGKHRG